MLASWREDRLQESFTFGLLRDLGGGVARTLRPLGLDIPIAFLQMSILSETKSYLHCNEGLLITILLQILPHLGCGWFMSGLLLPLLLWTGVAPFRLVFFDSPPLLCILHIRERIFKVITGLTKLPSRLDWKACGSLWVPMR